MRGHGNPSSYGACACYCAPNPCYFGPGYGMWWEPRTREEVVQDLEGYKERLELEIRELEKRIKRLHEEAST